MVEVSSEGVGSADIDETISAKLVSPSLFIGKGDLSPPLGHGLLPFAVASLVHPPNRKSLKARAA